MHKILWRIKPEPKFVASSYRTRQRLTKMLTSKVLVKKPFLRFYDGSYKFFNIPYMMRGAKWERLHKLRITVHNIKHRGSYNER